MARCLEIEAEARALFHIYSGRPLLGNDLLAIYRLLAHVPVSHCCDVGAAAGVTTKLMKRYAPHATIDAFEPFPGNFPFIEREVSLLEGVRLHHCAVSASEGPRLLSIAATVTGSEPGWEKFAGYSSGSRLIGDRLDARDTLEVECRSIDSVVDCRISFLKIDVQGTERDVLESARRHFERGDVDLALVEFNGEKEITGFLADFDFLCFATPILIVSSEPIGATLSDVEVVQHKRMSNGAIGECCWMGAAPSGANLYSEYIQELKRDLKRPVQTDLVCVAPHFAPEFFRGAARLWEEKLASG